MSTGMGMGMGWGRMRYGNEQPLKPKVTKSLIKRVLSYFIPYWKTMILVFITFCNVGTRAGTSAADQGYHRPGPAG